MIRIPAIDLINGSCVRLTKGEFDKSVFYDSDPIKMAMKYEEEGAKYIHIIDLDAARGIASNKQIIFDIRKHTNLKIQTGGGIRNVDQVDEFLDRGINAVIIGSTALKERENVKKWISHYGNENIIVGADVRNNKIAVDGWLSTSEENITDFIFDYKLAGASTFLCTDIQKDGMLEGTSNDLYNNLLSKFPDLQFIASGGVSSIADLEILEEMNMYACVIGKALFENKIELKKLFSKTKSL
jgi:phosphoribosylformimino-5-aminoimidazole carboxamide ribotide isomerase